MLKQNVFFFTVTVQKFLNFRDLMFDKKVSLDEGRVEEIITLNNIQ